MLGFRVSGVLVNLGAAVMVVSFLRFAVLRFRIFWALCFWARLMGL